VLNSMGFYNMQRGDAPSSNAWPMNTPSATIFISQPWVARLAQHTMIRTADSLPWEAVSISRLAPRCSGGQSQSQKRDQSTLVRHDSEDRRDTKHVLLISVDRMHALDLTNYVAAHPSSTLARLSGHGITYTNASTPFVSDSFPGLAALTTGDSPPRACQSVEALRMLGQDWREHAWDNVS
jgi:hypothetical protein